MFQKTDSSSLGWFVLLALLLHVAIAVIPPRSPLSNSDPLRARLGEDVIVLEDLPKRPIATTEKNPLEVETTKDPQFGAQQKNRVAEQTQSRLRGAFREGGGTPAPSPGQSPGMREEFEQRSDGELDRKGGEISLSDLLPESSSPDKLPDDIKQGNRTLLNADEIQYSSFIFRVRDVIYDNWRSRLIDMDRLFAVTSRRLKPHKYITVLAVLLNAEGEVTSVETLESSGIHEVDEAPRLAFWDAAKFPNPPEQMLGDRGFVRFLYRFEYEVGGNSLSIVPMIL